MTTLAGELSACETLIMKIVWDAQEDIAVQEIIRELGLRYDKNYARTTVVTFLSKMAEKGYVSTYRKGRTAYVHAEKSEADYKRRMIQEDTEFWYGGKTSNLVAALCEANGLSPEEEAKIREVLKDVD